MQKVLFHLMSRYARGRTNIVFTRLDVKNHHQAKDNVAWYMEKLIALCNIFNTSC